VYKRHLNFKEIFIFFLNVLFDIFKQVIKIREISLEKNTLKSSLKKLLLNSQKRPGSGSGAGSAIRKNAKSGSALNQCRSETLFKNRKYLHVH
jgi:hypothetical protein